MALRFPKRIVGCLLLRVRLGAGPFQALFALEMRSRSAISWPRMAHTDPDWVHYGSVRFHVMCCSKLEPPEVGLGDLGQP